MIEIEKPKISLQEVSEDGKYGKFVIEPLERGFGNTLGKIRWYANGTLDILEDVLNKNFIRKKYNEDK